MAEMIDVRSLLAEEPALDRWKELCQLIDAFDVDERNEVIIPYCRQHLELTASWSKQRRPAPKEWAHAFSKGQDVHPQLSLVSHLDLSGLPELRQEILDFVSDISSFVLLRVLKLNYLDLQDEHIDTLVQSEHFKQLQALYLERNKIGPDGAKILAEAPNLSSLQNLNLSGNPIQERGAIAIANTTTLKSLRFLNLNSCDVEKESEGGQAIANSPHLSATVKAGWHH